MPALERHRVTVSGPADGQPMVFAHGFGCDQSMWRLVAPAFTDHYRVVLFDHVGAGGSDLDAYDAQTYATLDGYARDLVAICEELDLRDVVLVAHSVSAMIGVLTQVARPDLVARLVLLGPSARYIDDVAYVGGFSEDDITELLELMASNNLGWQTPLSRMVMPGVELEEPRSDLHAAFCRVRPDIAAQFAEVTFRGDNRADLAAVTAPTLVLQNSDDPIAPLSAGSYVAAQIPGARLQVIETTGHCAHLSAPEETIAAIRAFVES